MQNHNSDSGFLWVLSFVSFIHSEKSVDWWCSREGFKEIIWSWWALSYRKVDEVAQWGASYFVFIHKYHYAHQIVENGVGGAWKRRERWTRFYWESPWKIVRSEVQGIVEKMGSELILGNWLGDLEWIQLAQYRDWWRSTGNMVINLRMLAPRS
jgi:hypothetical protein